jgi:hypothetical protein
MYKNQSIFHILIAVITNTLVHLLVIPAMIWKNARWRQNKISCINHTFPLTINTMNRPYTIYGPDITARCHWTLDWLSYCAETFYSCVRVECVKHTSREYIERDKQYKAIGNRLNSWVMDGPHHDKGQKFYEMNTPGNEHDSTTKYNNII